MHEGTAEKLLIRFFSFFDHDFRGGRLLSLILEKEKKSKTFQWEGPTNFTCDAHGVNHH